MKEGIEKAQEHPEDIFRKFYSDGVLVSTNISELSPSVLKEMEWVRNNFSGGKELLPDPSFLYRIDHVSGDQTYIAEVYKKFEEDSEDLEGRVTYFVDVKDGEYMGSAQLRKLEKGGPKHQEMIGKPYVENMYTNHQEQGKGYGTRRWKVIEAYSQMRYGCPALAIDSTLTKQGAKFMERLREKGLVRKITVEGSQQYRLKKPKSK